MLENVNDIEINHKPVNDKFISLCLLVLVVVQPLLDVLSYFMAEYSLTAITTLLRMVMFAVIFVYGFWISDNKKVYYIFALIAGGYWALHMANCFRIGYVSPFNDTANFIRIIQLPALTLAFITFNKKTDRWADIYQKGFSINYLIIILVILMSYLTGRIEYTYTTVNVGVMGWFAVHNAQSAIVMLLVPFSLFYAYRKGTVLFFIMSVLCFGLLFFTGTRLTFYSIFIIAAGFICLFAINGVLERNSIKEFLKVKGICSVILLSVMILSVICIKWSPMQIRMNAENTSFSNYQNVIDNAGRDTTADNDEDNMGTDVTTDDVKDDSEITDDGKAEQNDVLKNSDEERLNSIYKKYNTVPGLRDIISVFGVERVAEHYGYTTDSFTLRNVREKKKAFAKLSFEDKDFITKCLGYEYSTLITDKENYDLENDFPGVFYFFGYIGFALYLIPFLYCGYLIVKELFTNWKWLFSLESGAVSITFILLAGAAQLSGNVLRRPNVSIYLSMVMAYMYMLYGNRNLQNTTEQDSTGFNEKQREV